MKITGKHRILSLVLSFLMVLSVVPVTAFAADDSDPQDAVVSESGTDTAADSEDVKETEPQGGDGEAVKETGPQSGANEAVKATDPQSGDSGNKNENENAVNDAAAASEDPAQATVESYIASVGDVKYGTLEEAINAAQRNETVTLLADTRENVTIGTYGLTLDLNGYTLNGGTVKGKPALLINNGRVTVKDSSTAQTGTIMREDTAENSGSTSHYVIDVQGKDGFLCFEGGNVKNNSGIVGVKGASLIRLGDDSVKAWPTLTIKGGTFTQDNFIAIKVDRGTLYLKGGTVNSANSYAVENWNNAYIKGNAVVNGTVSSWVYSTGAPYSKLEISGGTVNGNVCSVNYDNAADKQARIYVTGGTITGRLGTYTYNNGLSPMDETTKATIEVTGGTFKEDPTKYVVEGSAINKNSDGTFGVEKAYLAQVGNTSYYTMDEAFKAQTTSGEAIVLLRDYNAGATTFNSGSINRTVDLNGHTWTCTGTDVNSAAFEINYPDVTLTVKNGKVVSSQMAGLIPSAMSGTITYDNAGLVFDGVEMTVNARSGIETNGNNTNDTVTLRNSTLNVPNGFGIYFPSSGTLTIDNSVINAKTMGVQVCAGSLNISGEKTAITVTGDAVPKTGNDGAIEDGSAISIVERTGYKGLNEIKVADGKFTAKTGNEAVKAYKWESQTEGKFTEAAKVSVSGGTFSSAVDKTLCADGYVPTTNTDGTYGVKEGSYVAAVGDEEYESLAEAIKAAGDGETVALLADVEQNSQLTIDKSITLDLNGKTIKNTKDIWSDNANSILSINKGAKVTITGNGTIDAKENDCYTINVVKGDLTIENGTFYGNISVVQVQEGTLSVKGGHFDLRQKWKGSNMYLFNCIDDAYASGAATVAVSGGTFVDFDPNVSPEHKVDGKTPSFAAPGVGITKNEDGSFTAIADMKAQILDAAGDSVKAYGSLAEAIEAAKDGETVKLLADVTEDVTINKSITLDLGGKTLTNTNAGKATISVVNGAVVTVKNGNVVGGTSYYNIEVKDSKANLTLTDVTATAGNTGSSMIDNWGTLTITSGTYTGGLDTVKNEPAAKLTISGGTFTLTKGTSNGFTGVVFNYGDLTISGGEFIQSDKSAPYGQAQVIHTDKSGSTAPSTAITGGTFKNLCTRTTAWTVRATNAAAGATKVSGGTFNKKISDGYCADGFIPTKNADGTYGVKVGSYVAEVESTKYETLADAVRSAKSGKTVTLLADVEQNSQLTINKNITLDLNQMKVTGSFVINGEVTIQNGTINVPDGETNFAYGSLTLKNVAITGTAVRSSLLSVNNNGNVTVDKNSTIVANSVKNANPAVFIKGQDKDGKTYEPVLNIYGKVESGKTPAIQGNGTDRGVSHVNVFDGASVKSESLAVYLPQPCEMNITGGTVEGYCGIGIKSGTLNITGGTVRGVANDNVIGDQYSQTDGISYDGSAIMIDSFIGYAGQVQINISSEALVESKYSTAIREIGNDKSQTNLVGLMITGGKVLGAKGTDAVLVRNVTADDVNISGGEFSSIVKKEYCAPGFTPVTKANSEGLYEVEVGHFTVKVTSRTTTSDSPVANVSGGGSDITYAAGTTVTASSISGYKFVGWFVDGYTDTATAYSTDLTCTVKPTGDCTMVAVYEPVSGGKFWLTVTASEFTINGGAVHDSNLYDQIGIGEQVTVKFTGTEKFLYWVNASNKVVSTDVSYTFIMGSETTLKAVYGKARQNQATVVFISHSDQMISSRAYTNEQEIQFPVPPIKMGCTFTGWSMTEGQIRAAMAQNNGIIEVRALYTEPSVSCKVTVIYPEGTGNVVVDTVVGKAIEITAKDIEDKTFSYWTDEKGNILGYTKTLKLAPSGDMTVKAVYNESATAEPVITMTAVDTSEGNGYYVVSFTATRAVPEGYELVKQGILYSVDSRCAADGAKDYLKLTEDGTVPEGVYEFSGSNTDLNGVTRFNCKVQKADAIVYGRGYMVLKNSAGEVLYVYTDTILSGSYDNLKK